MRNGAALRDDSGEVFVEDAEPGPIIVVENVRKLYSGPRSGFWGHREEICALRDVSFSVRDGEILGIVGESGSGKSTLTRLLLALEKPDHGVIKYRDMRIDAGTEAQITLLRREVQAVFQDPGGSLDPRMRIRDSISEPLRALRLECDREARVEEVLNYVGLGASVARLYPRELSGGGKQRVALARALVTQPRVLIADEAVSALDVSVKAQILALIMNLQRDLGLTVIFVSHDMEAVGHMCDRVVVIRQGEIVESGSVTAVFSHPEHPYTRALIDAVPRFQ